MDCLPTPPAPPGVREGVKVRGELAELKGLGESLGKEVGEHRGVAVET